MSDNGVDEALQGFVLIRKIEREIITKVCAGHEQFNSTRIKIGIKIGSRAPKSMVHVFHGYARTGMRLHVI